MRVSFLGVARQCIPIQPLRRHLILRHAFCQVGHIAVFEISQPLTAAAMIGGLGTRNRQPFRQLEPLLLQLRFNMISTIHAI